MDAPLNIIFMGTPEFAIPSLRALLDSQNRVICIVTQTDKESGRGRHITFPPVKILGNERGIKILQPEKIKDENFLNEIKNLNPDLIVVTAYGKILPKTLLDIPKFGCLNVHASILPKYRGAAPINWAIINGEKKTGVTIMKMDEKMDHGKILMVKEIEIGEDDDAKIIHDKLSELGAKALIETIELLKRDELKPVTQDDSMATLAPMLKKEDGKIDWKKSAIEIHNLVRGVTPWPGAYTFLEGKLLKIHKTMVYNNNVETNEPGKVLETGVYGILVATSKGGINLKELQLEGGKRLSAEEFLRGHSIKEGTIFG